MKKVEIRLAKEEEVPTLREIIIKAYAPITSILGRAPRGALETEQALLERIKNKTVYSVLLEGELVGTFTMSPNPRYGGLMEVSKVAVRTDKQNKGLGTYIMSSAEHLARLMDERKVIIETYEDHKQLVDFYLHRGYKIFDKRLSKGNVILLMEKKLWRED